MTNKLEKRADIGVFITLIAFTIIFPCLNAFTAEGSAMHISGFQLRTWGKYMCYAVLALSLNMLWGYTGLLCLGQCLFFALGGYAFGMYLVLMIGESGDIANLPLFLNWDELPAIWEPFFSPIFAIGAVLLVPGIVAFIFGFLAFRSRIKGVYFSILTQALTYAGYLLFNSSETPFGGTNGFTNYKFIFGADMNTAAVDQGLFIATGILLLGVYALLTWLLATKFGKVQRAIRDSENRVRFSGFSTTHYKVFIFVLSAMIAGAAGALYVPQAGIINPSEMMPAKGLDIVVWVAVGGRSSKFGPVVGAILVSLLKSYTTQAFPEYWLIILGGIFVIVVIFLPDGVVGLIKKMIKKLQGKPSDSDDLETGFIDEEKLEKEGV